MKSLLGGIWAAIKFVFGVIAILGLLGLVLGMLIGMAVAV